MSKEKRKDSKAKTPRQAPPKGAGKARQPAETPASKKPDPTRFGDWEKNGRCIDF